MLSLMLNRQQRMLNVELLLLKCAVNIRASSYFKINIKKERDNMPPKRNKIISFILFLILKKTEWHRFLSSAALLDTFNIILLARKCLPIIYAEAWGESVTRLKLELVGKIF